MKKWITLDAEAILKRTLEKSSGRTTYLSPFDIPTSAGLDFEEGVLTIEFSYIGGVERTERFSIEGMVFHVGRSSRRLYRIEATVSHLQPMINSSIESGIDAFLHKQEIQSRSRGSYKAAKDVIDSGSLNLISSQIVTI